MGINEINAAAGYFRSYFAEHKDQIGYEAIEQLVDQKFTMMKHEKQPVIAVARREYCKGVLIPIIEDILKESKDVLDLRSLVGQGQIDEEFKDSLSSHLINYALTANSNLIVVVHQNKNYYKYDPECSAVKKLGKTLTKGRCYSNMCRNPKLCPKELQKKTSEKVQEGEVESDI